MSFIIFIAFLLSDVLHSDVLMEKYLQQSLATQHISSFSQLDSVSVFAEDFSSQIMVENAEGKSSKTWIQSYFIPVIVISVTVFLCLVVSLILFAWCKCTEKKAETKNTIYPSSKASTYTTSSRPVDRPVRVLTTTSSSPTTSSYPPQQSQQQQQKFAWPVILPPSTTTTTTKTQLSSSSSPVVSKAVHVNVNTVEESEETNGVGDDGEDEEAEADADVNTGKKVTKKKGKGKGKKKGKGKAKGKSPAKKSPKRKMGKTPIRAIKQTLATTTSEYEGMNTGTPVRGNMKKEDDVSNSSKKKKKSVKRKAGEV